MRKLKIYLDTSVISHLLAEDVPEKMKETLAFWKDIVNGKYEIYLSPVTTDEVENCSEPKRSQMFKRLKQVKVHILSRTDEVTRLADEYISKGVLPAKSYADCLHIAFAVVHSCDIIVSWNFRHLVNYRTINKIKVVNAINHYREITIMPPTMLLEEVSEND